MLKIPRFMKEYARYQRKCIESLQITQVQLNSAMKNISSILSKYEHGVITINESMKMLSDIWLLISEE